jgi:hypothetical protein
MVLVVLHLIQWLSDAALTAEAIRSAGDKPWYHRKAGIVFAESLSVG